MEMVNADRNLFQLCLQQFFSWRDDDVLGSEAVMRGVRGDEVLRGELWGVLSPVENASVLAEEKKVLREESGRIFLLYDYGFLVE